MGIKHYIIAGCLFIFLGSWSSVFALLNPSSLVTVPHAIFPQRGDLTYGGASRYYLDENRNQLLDYRTGYSMALSKRFQVGMQVTSQYKPLFSVSAQLINYPLFNMDHYVALGVQNVGYGKTDNIQFSWPTIRHYGVYSVHIPRLRSAYHLGVLKIASDYYIMAGAHYEFKYFSTMAEWDGHQVHFGVLYHLTDRIDLFSSITPSPSDYFSDNLVYFSVGIRVRDQLIKHDKKIAALEKQIYNVNQQLTLLDAKANVIREFSSMDFLEEFQHFLLKEHQVEKALEDEQKYTIKQALDHMQRGLEFYYQGMYEKALHEYQAVVVLVPNLSIGFARLGSIYYKLNDLSNARDYWQKALDLDPENESLHLFLKRITPSDPLDKTEVSPELNLDALFYSEDRT